MSPFKWKPELGSLIEPAIQRPWSYDCDSTSRLLYECDSYRSVFIKVERGFTCIRRNRWYQGVQVFLTMGLSNH